MKPPSGSRELQHFGSGATYSVWVFRSAGRPKQKEEQKLIAIIIETPSMTPPPGSEELLHDGFKTANYR